MQIIRCPILMQSMLASYAVADAPRYVVGITCKLMKTFATKKSTRLIGGMIGTA